MSAPTTCRNRCGANVLLRVLTTTGKWGVFDDQPVKTVLKDSNRHWWLSGRHAAPISVLVDQIQQTRRLPDDEAAAAAREEWDWHQFHDCPHRPDLSGGRS